MGKVDCEACDGEGTREVETVEGDWVGVECDECRGFGSFAIFGPLTAEQEAELEARAAAFEVNSAKWTMFVCTHCWSYCDAWAERGPTCCHHCNEGVMVPLRDLQAVARPALPWRRQGDTVVTLEPPDPAQGLLFQKDPA